MTASTAETKKLLEHKINRKKTTHSETIKSVQIKYFLYFIKKSSKVALVDRTRKERNVFSAHVKHTKFDQNVEWIGVDESTKVGHPNLIDCNFIDHFTQKYNFSTSILVAR